MSKRILRVDIPIGHINEDLIKEISFMLLMNPGLGVNTRVVEKKSNHSKKTKKPRTESYVMLEKTPRTTEHHRLAHGNVLTMMTDLREENTGQNQSQHVVNTTS